MKQYLVIETFKNGQDNVYERFYREGRMLPEGLTYLNSWLEKDGKRCFQLMETNEPSLFQKWIQHWNDIVDFEIIEIEEKSNKTYFTK